MNRHTLVYEIGHSRVTILEMQAEIDRLNAIVALPEVQAAIAASKKPSDAVK